MTIPLSLYIHIPWCLRKCPYCDFYSIPTNRDSIPEEKYIEALIRDFKIDLKKLNVEKRTLISIFIGGGTPSLFSAKSIGYLLDEIHKNISFERNIEITLEANPGAFDQRNFADFLLSGINRLSLGIQSFQDEKLRKLGRIHSAEEAKLAIEKAHLVGFNNINLDLMYGLPNQTVYDACYDLKTAVGFNPTHLSWYQLTLEPDTPFGSDPPQVPSEDVLWDIQKAGQSLLNTAGYQHYEISAYSKPNFHCRHNTNYWQFGDYLGIGAGAHGKITSLDCDMIRRYRKKSCIENYLLQNSFIAETKIVSKLELPLEFMINALRLIKGVPTNLFVERTGLTLKTISECLKKTRQNGFLEYDETLFKTTVLGQNFLNDCLAIFVP